MPDIKIVKNNSENLDILRQNRLQESRRDQQTIEAGKIENFRLSYLSGLGAEKSAVEMLFEIVQSQHRRICELENRR